jgi:hypothetical protein
MRGFLRLIVGVLPAGLIFAACAAGGSIPTTTPSSPGALGSPASTSVPTLTTAPTPSSIPLATEAPTAPDKAAGLARDSYAMVVTSDLRVRSKPGVSEDSKKLEPLLRENVLVLVLDGPVHASGYDWYLVQPTVQSDTQEVTYPFGWVAAADKNGEPWLQADAFECPPLPESADELGQLNQVGALWVEIGCFAGQEITFRARLGQPDIECGAEPPWGVDPIWFDSCGSDASFLVPIENSHDGPVVFPRWAPGVDTSIAGQPGASPDQWPVVEVTGMFDHPAAQTCRNTLNYEDGSGYEPDPAYTIANCRRAFVVTSMEGLRGP